MSTRIAYYTPTLSYYQTGYSGTLMAQTFTPTAGYDRIDYVRVPLRRLGTVSGNVTAYIYATSGGVPTGSALGSASITASSVSTSGSSYYTFDFGTDVTITSGAKYAIVISHGGTDSSNTIVWWRGTSADYTGGQGFYKYSGGSWTDWGVDLGFEVYGYLSATPPSVTTNDPTSVAETTVTLNGNLTSTGGASVTAKGFYLSDTDATPDNNDTIISVAGGTVGAYLANVTGLEAGTTYYYVAFATNSQGTTSGAVKSFTTTTDVPDVTTGSITEIGTETARAYGNVTSDHGATVTQRGFVIGSSASPEIGDPGTTTFYAPAGGTGEYNIQLTGLTPNTAYHIQAFAINSNGTSYGGDSNFTTADFYIEWSQKITAPFDGTLTKVSVPLKLIAGTSGNAILKLKQDNSGDPGTTLQSLVVKAIINSAYAYQDFTASLAVTSGLNVWLSLEYPYVNGSYHINWGADSGAGTNNLKYKKSADAGYTLKTGWSANYEIDFQPTMATEYAVKITNRNKYV